MYIIINLPGKSKIYGLSKGVKLNQRDKEDVETCIKKFKITKNQIMECAKQVEYVGREENYEINLQYVLRKFFN